MFTAKTLFLNIVPEKFKISADSTFITWQLTFYLFCK